MENINLNEYYVSIEYVDGLPDGDIDQWVKSGNSDKITKKMQKLYKYGGSFVNNNYQVTSTDPVLIPFIYSHLNGQWIIEYADTRYVHFYPALIESRDTTNKLDPIDIGNQKTPTDTKKTKRKVSLDENQAAKKKQKLADGKQGDNQDRRTNKNKKINNKGKIDNGKLNNNQEIANGATDNSGGINNQEVTNNNEKIPNEEQVRDDQEIANERSSNGRIDNKEVNNESTISNKETINHIATGEMNTDDKIDNNQTKNEKKKSKKQKLNDEKIDNNGGDKSEGHEQPGHKDQADKKTKKRKKTKSDAIDNDCVKINSDVKEKGDGERSNHEIAISDRSLQIIGEENLKIKKSKKKKSKSFHLEEKETGVSSASPMRLDDVNGSLDQSNGVVNRDAKQKKHKKKHRHHDSDTESRHLKNHKSSKKSLE